VEGQILLVLTLKSKGFRLKNTKTKGMSCSPSSLVAWPLIKFKAAVALRSDCLARS
jgi:hypothetical protein